MNEFIAHPSKTFAILAETIGAICLLVSVFMKDSRIQVLSGLGCGGDGYRQSPRHDRFRRDALRRGALRVEFFLLGSAYPEGRALGKVRLPDITGVPDWGWFVILSAIAALVFWLIETRFKPDPET